MGYLKSWETSVGQQEGYSAKEKMMLMPDETLLGINVTGNKSYSDARL